jgi:hypothetical protein
MLRAVDQFTREARAIRFAREQVESDRRTDGRFNPIGRHSGRSLFYGMTIRSCRLSLIGVCFGIPA